MSKETPTVYNTALKWHFARIANGRGLGRLREDMKEAGIDIGQGTLSRLSKGDPGARMESLNKLAQYDRCEPESLLKMPDEENDAEHCDVNHLDVKLAAGDGHVEGYAEVVGSLKFKRSFLRACGVKPEKAKVVDVKGHSMHPVIPDGSVVLIDTASQEPIEGKIFALARAFEGLVIKRLVKEGGYWVAKSDNPAEQSYPINDGEPIKIIGKAVWVGVTL